MSICCVSHKMRQYLPSVACRRGPPAGMSSAVMSTSILPVKAGAKDLVRRGADKRTTSCSPSLAVGSLTENIGPTICLKEGGGREGRNERGRWKEGEGGGSGRRRGEKEGRGEKRKNAVDCSEGNDINIAWHLMVPHARV